MRAIRLLKRSEIDAGKWDACIDAAVNGVIYAKSYYLDALSDNWSALVTADYTAVMPLPFKKKYGISYVCMPPFTPQLGCFQANSIHAAVLTEMIAQAQCHFLFGDYHFNNANLSPGFQQRNNYVLSLNNTYETLHKAYKKDLKKNLNRCKQFQLNYEKTADYETAIHLYKAQYGKRSLGLQQSAYEDLKKLCAVLFEKEELLVRNATDNSKELLATAICLKDRKRLYLILSATTKEGRAVEANHFLLDHFIHEFAGQHMILDFEGSDLEGIAHFYRNFGSTNEPYYFLRWNNLPWPIRLLKNNM